MIARCRLWVRLVFAALLSLLAVFFLFGPKTQAPVSHSSPVSSPLPGGDRLAEPPLPNDPTQYEWGRYLYWLNCMPCHGDRGQGLTDEFRSLWEADHQNCWAVGCHAGRREDQGFPIPRNVPPIISADGTLPHYETASDLFEFLRSTHPPQHPGYLPEEQYWAIANYVFVQSGRLSPEQRIGPGTLGEGIDGWQWVAAGLLWLAAAALLFIPLRAAKR